MSLLNKQFGSYTPLEVGAAATRAGLNSLELGEFFQRVFKAAVEDMRDKLAAQALTQVMQQYVNYTYAEGETREQMFGRKAYEIADAMLKARQP